MQDHHHSHTPDAGLHRLSLAIVINVLLTLVQVIGGIISGSLALISDALHNFSDAGTLLIALIARKVSRKPADTVRTFGYRRAETIGALINVTLLLVMGLYLIYEAILRLIDPKPVEGWTVIWVAGVAFLIDAATAVLTYSYSKDNLNFRAAFIHNVSDALGSIMAMLTGVVVLIYGMYLFDALAALLIAGYVLYQGIAMMKSSIHILMESVPEGIRIDALIKSLEAIDHIENIHHVHIWELDENHRALEAHVVIDEKNLALMEDLKVRIKQTLSHVYAIHHTTLEFELGDERIAQCCLSPSSLCATVR